MHYDVNGCILCDNGAVDSSNGTCPGSVTSYSNCIIADYDLSSCLRCATSYVWDGTACSDSVVSDCYLFNAQGNCICCDSGYSLVNGTCQSTTAISNCQC